MKLYPDSEKKLPLRYLKKIKDYLYDTLTHCKSFYYIVVISNSFIITLIHA